MQQCRPVQALSHLEAVECTCRDYADHPEGIMYEVAGESVIPGIDCQNVESIFEEHTLCSQLDPLAAQHNVFAIATQV